MVQIAAALLLLGAARGAAQVAVSSSPLAINPAINVVWPKEGSKYPYLKRSFTFGSVTPGSTLTINGLFVPVRASGAFLTMIDLGTGTFRIQYSATLGSASTSTARSISVDIPYGMAPLDYRAIKTVEPEADLTLRSGDLLIARCMGPPGMQATMDIRHVARGLPMAEKSGSGLYEGHYRIQPEDRGKDLEIRFTLRGKSGKLKGQAAGRLTIADPALLSVVKTTAEMTVVKSGSGGYTLFLPPGVLLEATGSSGPMMRVSLADGYEAWVDSDRVTPLPAGTPPPEGGVGRQVSVSTGKDSTRVYIQVDKELPFEIHESVDPLCLEVRFYGGMQRMDRIHYASDDPIVRAISWRQESSRVALVRVDTRLAWGWGYEGRYEGGRFVLEIRKPPALSEDRDVLAGRKVALDPGHGPELSAIGPLGTAERDVNLAIALRLKEFLERQGASVYMIRTSSAGPPLLERPALAWHEGAELYVSVHANALPVEADPYETPRGYMDFYYQPQSRRLAEAIHRSYQINFPEPADEGLRWGDLHVCRATQMPSVLVESAYIMLPEQEELLRDPAYQARFARAMLGGIEDFYEAYRSVQLASPEERRAASY